MKKRLIALLLAVCMIISMAPAVLAAGSVFTDVEANAWYADEVQYVYDNGLMNGVGNNQFDPDGLVTRAMMWTTLARLDGVNTSSNPWWLAGHKWAMDEGISDGTAGENTLTREQMVTMLYRYAKYLGVDVSKAEGTDISAYPDADSVSDWAVTAMRWACGVGIINGINGTLQPQSAATRSQLAAVLYRFNETIVKAEPEEPHTCGEWTTSKGYHTCGICNETSMCEAKVVDGDALTCAVCGEDFIVADQNSITVEDTTINSDGAGLETYGNATLTNVTMNAGSPSDYAVIGRGGTTTLTNLTLDSKGGGIAAADGAKVVFDGDSVAVNSASTSGRYNFYAEGEGSEITIKGGDISFSKTLNQKRAYIYAGVGTTVYVEGGNFGPASTRSGYTAGIKGEGTVIITGGTFGFDPSAWVADGYGAVKTDKIWTVSPKSSS